MDWTQGIGSGVEGSRASARTPGAGSGRSYGGPRTLSLGGRAPVGAGQPAARGRVAACEENPLGDEQLSIPNARPRASITPPPGESPRMSHRIFSFKPNMILRDIIFFNDSDCLPMLYISKWD